MVIVVVKVTWPSEATVAAELVMVAARLMRGLTVLKLRDQPVRMVPEC